MPPIQFILLCRQVALVAIFSLESFQKFSLLISSTTFPKSSEKSEQNSRNQKMNSKILVLLCPLVKLIKCIFFGTWLLNLFKHTKTKFKENMMHAEKTQLAKVQSNKNSQAVLESRWDSTNFTASMINSTRLKSTLIWLLNVLLLCMKVIVFLASHQLMSFTI